MKRRAVYGLVSGLVLAWVGPAGAAGGLTLEEVLSRVLGARPSLQAATAEAEAREGAALQTGSRVNPEVAIEVEGLGAPGGGDAIETTLSVGQALELGGKRTKRQRAAALEADLARWSQAAARQDLLA